MQKISKDMIISDLVQIDQNIIPILMREDVYKRQGGKEYQRNPQSLKFVIIQSYIRICKYIRKTFAKSAFSA